MFNILYPEYIFISIMIFPEIHDCQKRKKLKYEILKMGGVQAEKILTQRNIKIY